MIDARAGAMSAEDFVAPEDLDRVRENMRRWTAGESDDMQNEYTGLRKDGSRVMTGASGNFRQPVLRGIEKALEEIECNAGRLYDPRVAVACLRLFRDKGYVLPA